MGTIVLESESHGDITDISSDLVHVGGTWRIRDSSFSVDEHGPCLGSSGQKSELRAIMPFLTDRSKKASTKYDFVGSKAKGEFKKVRMANEFQSIRNPSVCLFVNGFFLRLVSLRLMYHGRGGDLTLTRI